MHARFLDVRARRRRPEAMDDPALEREPHEAALRGLARINVLSRSVGVIWGSIVSMQRAASAGPLRILDIATGGGDVPIGLWRRARSAGIDVEIVGVDVSETALDVARRHATRAGAAVEFRRLDALRDDWPTGFEVVTCSLFLHHLDEADAEAFLRKAKTAARKRVVVDDLDRSRVGLLLARVVPRFLSRSDVVHVDAARSVEGAFTYAEIDALASRAGLARVRIVRRFPCRWLLTWDAP